MNNQNLKNLPLKLTQNSFLGCAICQILFYANRLHSGVKNRFIEHSSCTLRHFQFKIMLSKRVLNRFVFFNNNHQQYRISFQQWLQFTLDYFHLSVAMTITIKRYESLKKKMSLHDSGTNTDLSNNPIN